MSPPVTWLPTWGSGDHMRWVRTVAEETHLFHTTLKLISSYPKTLAGGEFPFEVSVKSTNVDSSWNIDTLSEVIDVFEWTLDTVKDGAHDSWSELHRERFTCPKDRVTNRHTSFIDTLGETNKNTRRHLKYVTRLVTCYTTEEGNATAERIQVSSYTWIVAMSPSKRMISPTSSLWPTRTSSYMAAPAIAVAVTTVERKNTQADTNLWSIKKRMKHEWPVFNVELFEPAWPLKESHTTNNHLPILTLVGGYFAGNCSHTYIHTLMGM